MPAGRTPNAPLQVFQSQILSGTLNNATPIATFGGETKTSGGQNNFNNRLWLRRSTSGGSDWTTAGLHDAISVDNSYGTPGSNTRTWWERRPGTESSGGTQAWGDRNVTYMTLKGDKLGIGTDNPQYKLDVKGPIRSTEVKIESVDKFPDYVFGNEYELRELESLKAFIETNGHLPEMPSAQEVKDNGMGLVDMQLKLLQKIEELTLYILEQNDKIKSLEKSLENATK